jgi:hypothetical protein
VIPFRDEKHYKWLILFIYAFSGKRDLRVGKSPNDFSGTSIAYWA